MIQPKDLANFLNITLEQLQENYQKPFEETWGPLSAINTQGSGSGMKKMTPSSIRAFLQSIGRGPQPKTITIAALKGGIGKTFLTTHVAVRASQFGMKVLLIDLDPEACATNSLLSENDLLSKNKTTILEILKYSESFEKGIVPTRYEGLYVVPSALKVSKTEKIVNGKNPKTLLKKYVDTLNFDFIFFELPPSFSTLSSAAYLASDTIVIPCTPNIHSLESVDLTIEAIKEVSMEFECPNMDFKVLMNMFNPKRNASQDVLQILQDDHPKHLLPFQIHESADILNAINAGITIFESKCSPKIREELDNLLKTLCPVVSIGQVSPRGSRKEYTLSSIPSPLPSHFANNVTLTQ